MRLAFANAHYQTNKVSGGQVHIGQFIKNAVALGHEIWAWSRNQHPDVHLLPTSNIKRLKALRRMDALYIRLESTPPGTVPWALPPHRLIYGFPLVVWEFNTIPDYAMIRGKSDVQVRQSIRTFQKYGRGCDLAVCVSGMLADYVRETLGIRRVMVAANGSDPATFHPQVTPIQKEGVRPDHFNVVWIGSADIAWHNFELLFEASMLLWERRDETKVDIHIIGPGFMLQESSIPPNVHYWGPVLYDELPHWLAAMDVGLSCYQPGPADYSSPLKIYDYMASGLAVVSTEQPQVREIFDQLDQLHLLVQHDDPRKLADVIAYLAVDRDLVRRQGYAGRKLVLDHYNWHHTVQDIFLEIERIFV